MLLIFAAVAVLAVSAADHIITVGKAAHRFDPEELMAAVGDTIIFEFYPKNHSVVRGSWEQPCIPYEKLEPQVRGFFSGFRPVRTIESDPPKFSVLVNDTDPIFFYCSALDSCNVWGMAGVVNPRNDTPIAEYQAEAKKPGTFVLQPGEDWPAEAENSRTPLGPSSVPTGGSELPSSSTSPPVQVVTAVAPGVTAAAATSGAMPVGGIAGVVLGSVAVVVLICGLFFYLGRRRRSDSTGHGTPPSMAYNKKGQPPVMAGGGYIPHQPPQQPLYGEAMSYRAYPPEPRAFPPGVLADDKLYNRQSQQGGPPVEIGNPTPGWNPRAASYASGGHTSPVPQSESGEQPPRRGVGSDSG